jgi:hypothetical protein
MPPAGFEPEIPASEQTQTHALDRAADRNILRLKRQTIVKDMIIVYSGIFLYSPRNNNRDRHAATGAAVECFRGSPQRYIIFSVYVRRGLFFSSVTVFIDIMRGNIHRLDLQSKSED